MALEHTARAAPALAAPTYGVSRCSNILSSSKSYGDGVAGRITDILAFGDYLSDSGNYYRIERALYNAAGTVLELETPSVQRYSDGPLWIEHLAQQLLNRPLRLGRAPLYCAFVLLDKTDTGYCYPLRLAALDGENFALAGAVCGNNCNSGNTSHNNHYNHCGGMQPLRAKPGLRLQNAPSLLPSAGKTISHYLNRCRDFSTDTLVTYTCGSNNLLLSANGSSGQDGAKAAQAALGDLEMLLSAGAKHLLAANLPHQADAPILQTNPSFNAALFIERFNNCLQDGIWRLQQQYPHAKLHLADFHRLFARLTNQSNSQNDPQQNDGAARIYAAHSVFDDEKALYWHSLYPSAATHLAMAQDALTMLQEDYFFTTGAMTSL